MRPCTYGDANILVLTACSQLAEVSSSYLNNANKTSHKLTLKAKCITLSITAVKSVDYFKSIRNSHYNGVYFYVNVVSTVDITSKRMFVMCPFSCCSSSL
jgi:hypothetical protein